MPQKRMMTIVPALAAAAAGCATTRPVEPVIGQEARIAFPNQATIRTFRPQGTSTVYIQDRAGRWFRANVLGLCRELPFTQVLGVDTRGGGTLDRFSVLIVEGERCPLNSFVRVAGPPPEAR